jgi:precorrin-8X/cobalt-precorrin-8 methylmutase
MTLFDAYVIVDWSASSVPKLGRDSIWLGRAERDGRRVTDTEPANPRTRAAAAALLEARLRDDVAAGRRVLVGFDFPYGHPHGFAFACGAVAGADPWRASWNRLVASIEDDERNANNRFAVAAELNARLGPGPGAFWGCPPRFETARLRRTGCTYPFATPSGRALERKRISERRLVGVQEVWKLFGIGSVGSQSLLGIPRVAALRDHAELAPHSRVWPFETGFTSRPAPEAGPFVLHAEIWPGIVRVDSSRDRVRDAAQVRTLARHFAALDDGGALGALFAPPDGLDATQLRACVAEEGWILGA